MLGTLDQPDRRLLNALGVLMANHSGEETRFAEHLQRIPKYKHPGLAKDNLYKAVRASGSLGNAISQGILPGNLPFRRCPTCDATVHGECPEGVSSACPAIAAAAPAG